MDYKCLTKISTKFESVFWVAYGLEYRGIEDRFPARGDFSFFSVSRILSKGLFTGDKAART
jgi:hypothetical protein